MEAATSRSVSVPLPICFKCWSDRHFGQPIPVSNPVKETCSYCGKDTNVGLFVYDIVDDVPFKRKPVDAVA